MDCFGKNQLWAFLAAQWLRLRASIAGDVGSIPGSGKILHAAWCSQREKEKSQLFLTFPATLFPGILYQKTATFPTSIPHSFLPNGFPWKSEIHSDVCGHSLAGCFLYVTSGIFQLHPDVDVGKNPDSEAWVICLGGSQPWRSLNESRGCFLKFTLEEAEQCEIKWLSQKRWAVKSGFDSTGDLPAYNPGCYSPLFLNHTRGYFKSWCFRLFPVANKKTKPPKEMKVKQSTEFSIVNV